MKDEPDGKRSTVPGSDSSFILPPSSLKYYQLTHDYLVHSLRDWLTRKQRETRRGRAELRLADRAALWAAKPENRHLPSVLEWANIRLLTRKSEWSEPQRADDAAGRARARTEGPESGDSDCSSELGRD